jgi:malonyl-CoA O-methyltransferase
MSNRDEIIRNFSRFAARYDDYSDVQNHAGFKLISSINGVEFGRILEVGCGTGNYTRLLRKRFAAATIKAIDVCSSMIDVARQKLREDNIDFIIADAEDITFAESFDLITSNACFQWLSRLDETIVNYGKQLDKDGIILFSLFGPLTFRELRASLRELCGPNLRISADTFINMDELSDILANRFNIVSAEEEVFEKRYHSLWELLQTIKCTGTRGAGLNGKVLSKIQIRQLEKIYNQQFDGINATYQIFYCQIAKKN